MFIDTYFIIENSLQLKHNGDFLVILTLTNEMLEWQAYCFEIIFEFKIHNIKDEEENFLAVDIELLQLM